MIVKGGNVVLKINGEPVEMTQEVSYPSSGTFEAKLADMRKPEGLPTFVDFAARMGGRPPVFGVKMMADLLANPKPMVVLAVPHMGRSLMLQQQAAMRGLLQIDDAHIESIHERLAPKPLTEDDLIVAALDPNYSTMRPLGFSVEGLFDSFRFASRGASWKPSAPAPKAPTKPTKLAGPERLPGKKPFEQLQRSRPPAHPPFKVTIKNGKLAPVPFDMQAGDKLRVRLSSTPVVDDGVEVSYSGYARAITARITPSEDELIANALDPNYDPERTRWGSWFDVALDKGCAPTNPIIRLDDLEPDQ